jgi:hypothetical protein
MKSQEEIEIAMGHVDTDHPQYPGMSYEDGILEALRWVMEEIPDDEFSPMID